MGTAAAEPPAAASVGMPPSTRGAVEAVELPSTPQSRDEAGVPPAAPADVHAASLEAAQAGEFRVDLGNLMVSHALPLDSSRVSNSSSPGLDALCLELGTAAVQHLASHLFALPSTRIKMGRLVQLPRPSTPLPREKPLPGPRQMTKWEKFAQAKGIKKRKRSKLVLEEGSEEWKRRYGYKRANDESTIPILEAKPTDEVGVDAFAGLRKSKKERVNKQEKNRLSNLKQAAKRDRGAAGPAGPALPSAFAVSAKSLPLNTAGPGVPGPAGPAMKPSKGEIAAAAAVASTATASLGKFDQKLKGAKAPKRTPKSLKVLPVTEPGLRNKKKGGGRDGASVGQERQLMQSLADSVIARKDTGASMDVNKAVSMLRKEGNKRGRSNSGDADSGRERNRSKGKGRGEKGSQGGPKKGRPSAGGHKKPKKG